MEHFDLVYRSNLIYVRSQQSVFREWNTFWKEPINQEYKAS